MTISIDQQKTNNESLQPKGWLRYFSFSLDHKVTMKMESKDVIHAFWVPEFRIKQDIIPGQPTILNFTPTKVGKYPIICAELCGPYHGGMRSSIIVEEESDYKEWFNKNTKTEVSL